MGARAPTRSVPMMFARLQQLDQQTRAFEASISKNAGVGYGKKMGDGYCSAAACGFAPSKNFHVVFPKITIKDDTPYQSSLGIDHRAVRNSLRLLTCRMKK